MLFVASDPFSLIRTLMMRLRYQIPGWILARDNRESYLWMSSSTVACRFCAN